MSGCKLLRNVNKGCSVPSLVYTIHVRRCAPGITIQLAAVACCICHWGWCGSRPLMLECLHWFNCPAIVCPRMAIS